MGARFVGNVLSSTPQHRSFTIAHVHDMRRWLQELGFETVLSMERIDGRNIVYLQLLVLDTPIRVDALWLNTLHRKLISRERLITEITRKYQEIGEGAIRTLDRTLSVTP